MSNNLIGPRGGLGPQGFRGPAGPTGPAGPINTSGNYNWTGINTFVTQNNTDNSDRVATTAFVSSSIKSKAPLDNPTFTGTVNGITKTMVGLGNVDNTSDALKPVSTATQTALALKAPLANPTFTGTVNGITKTMVGLGNVDNTSDALKPVSHLLVSPAGLLSSKYIDIRKKFGGAYKIPATLKESFFKALKISFGILVKSAIGI